MNLSRLNELNDKYEELEKRRKTKRNNADKEIEELKRQKEVLDKEIKSILDARNKEENNIYVEEQKFYEQIYEECKKVDVYGVFNINEIGEVLAKLASIITGVGFKFEIHEDREMGFTCIRNHGINFRKDIASLVTCNDEAIPRWNLCFAEASAPTEDDDICYMCDGYGGYGTCSKRTFKENEQLTTYIPKFKSFRFKDLFKKETEAFISHYLVFVSNYRLEKNLKTLSKVELEQLMKVFVDKYGSEYIRYYKEEKRKADEARAEFEEKMRVMKSSLALIFGPSYVIGKRRKR